MPLPRSKFLDCLAAVRNPSLLLLVTNHIKSAVYVLFNFWLLVLKNSDGVLRF